MEDYIRTTKLVLVRGDITEQDTEAIVNAANSSLLGGGGVDGAIHRVGGSEILEECQAIRAQQGRCPTGQAVITGGGSLQARYVIHAVGPIWCGGKRNEDALLCSAYRSSLDLAKKHNIQSISFPSISTGTYRFPLERAARLALSTVRDFLKEYPFREIRFVLFSEKTFLAYKAAWGEMKTTDYRL